MPRTPNTEPPRDAVCLFNSNRAWGGGEKWFLDHALLLAKRGWRVCCVVNRGSALAQRLRGHPEIPLLELPLGNLSFLNPLTLLRLAGFFRKQRVRAAILALPSDLKAGGLAARLAGVPRIFFRRGIALPTRDTAFNRFLFRCVLTGLICNSEHTRNMVLAGNPDLLPRERTFVLYNGLDVAALDAQPGTPLRERRPGEVLIGSAGRLTEQKGQTYLLQAAAQLRDQGLNFRVLLAGTGELEAGLRQQARDLNLEDRVEFLGFVQDMKAFYLSLDILALPSLWEGFGYVLTEAMALRLPVAAFSVSNIPEVVEHGRTGLLTPAAEVPALAQSLAALIQDPDLRTRLGAAGRQRVLERFEMGATLARLEALLRA